MVALAVDDEILVRMFIADYLDEAGFKIFAAIYADEALTILQTRPDVQAAVTGIEMQADSLNGHKLASAIRSTGWGSGWSSGPGTSRLRRPVGQGCVPGQAVHSRHHHHRDPADDHAPVGGAAIGSERLTICPS
jgi:hypothetical protein